MKFKAVPPCKDCTKRSEYLEKGLNCHTYCELYIEYSNERRRICEYNTMCAVVNRIHKENHTPKKKGSKGRK